MAPGFFSDLEPTKMKYEMKTCSVCGTQVMGEKSSGRVYCHKCGKFVDEKKVLS